QTFRESTLWQAVYYVGEAIDAVERLGLVRGTGSSVGAVMGGLVSGLPTVRVWASTDDGETWGPGDGQPLLEGPPTTTPGGATAVLSLGGASALVVLLKGTVYRTDDAG